MVTLTLNLTQHTLPLLLLCSPPHATVDEVEQEAAISFGPY